jgi:hypothetical protein
MMQFVAVALVLGTDASALKEGTIHSLNDIHTLFTLEDRHHVVNKHKDGAKQPQTQIRFAVHTPSECKSFVKKCWSKWADEFFDTLKSLKNGYTQNLREADFIFIQVDTLFHLNYPTWIADTPSDWHKHFLHRDRNWCRQDGAKYLREAEKCIEAFRQRLPTVVGSDKQTKLVVIPPISHRYQTQVPVSWFAQTDNVVRLLANAILGSYRTGLDCSLPMPPLRTPDAFGKGTGSKRYWVSFQGSDIRADNLPAGVQRKALAGLRQAVVATLAAGFNSTDANNKVHLSLTLSQGSANGARGNSTRGTSTPLPYAEAMVSDARDIDNGYIDQYDSNMTNDTRDLNSPQNRCVPQNTCCANRPNKDAVFVICPRGDMVSSELTAQSETIEPDLFKY